MLEVCWNWPTSYVCMGRHILPGNSIVLDKVYILLIPGPIVPTLSRAIHVIMDMELPLYGPLYATLSVVKLQLLKNEMTSISSFHTL